MDYKYIVVHHPTDDSKTNDTNENTNITHAEFFNSLRDIGNAFNIDHTTVSKRLTKNPNTFLNKKNIWIIKL